MKVDGKNPLPRSFTDYLVVGSLTLLFLGSVFAMTSSSLALKDIYFSLNQTASILTITSGVIGVICTVVFAALYLRSKKPVSPSKNDLVMTSSKNQTHIYPEIPSDKHRSFSLESEMIDHLKNKQFFGFMNDDNGNCLGIKGEKESSIDLFPSETSLEKRRAQLLQKGYKEIFLIPTKNGWTLSSNPPDRKLIVEHNQKLMITRK